MARKKRPAGESATPGSSTAQPIRSDAGSDAAARTPLPYPLVGIGASAGGLEALSSLLRALPTDTGMAFIVVQHLDPTHESKLAEILGRETSLKVVEVENEIEVKPNHVFVIPPGKNMVLADGRLQLSPRTEGRGQHRPIDHFLRSLAEQQGHRSIGVILSGSASDGTLGLEEIKAAAGVTFAQDSTAEHASMPQSAIAAGCVDFVLAPEEIGQEIGRISRHPYVGETGDTEHTVRSETLIGRVLEVLRNTTGADFANYKRNTLHRRITRRMLLHKLDGLGEYVRYLESTPGEAEALYQDVLINVTSFFRDAQAYEAIKSKVFPRLTEGKSRQDQVRVWALGCSTGEEAYSIAMAYTEYAEATHRRVPMQIFATDLNGASIEKARAGIYPKGIAQDISPERLRRFFIEVDGSYRICKPIRDMCVFAHQNVLADPPFSRMDLIACRNMLIYLEPVLQQRLLPILHYSLRQPGFLWLGSSETIGTFRDLFEIDDAKNKIYSKKPGQPRAGVQIPSRVAPLPLPRMERGNDVVVGTTDPQREADRILLARYAPPAVVVDSQLEIVQFRGDTGRYLAPSPGRASLNLLKMLREGLLVAVRGAVHRAMREKSVVREEGLCLSGGYIDLTITVVPITGVAREGFLLVMFEEKPPRSGEPAESKSGTPLADAHAQSEADARVIHQLRQELDATREYLQSVIEQQEAANEELQSANEEVQSANEELQSINEELETSKEEIQSSNEELATVNDELQNRNLELSQTNNDLLNLISSVQMAIVMLGRDLRIRRFTPTAEKMLNLIPSDVGRPIGDIKLGLDAPDIEALLLDVIDTVSVKEQTVQDKNGRWYSLRLRPYKTLENKIDGAVLMLIDVDQLKRAEQALRESEARFALLANCAPVLMWVNGMEGQQFVNKAYLDFLAVGEAEMQGYDWIQFIHPDDRDAYLAAYLAAFGKRAPFEHQFRLRRHDGEYRWMKASGIPHAPGGEFQGYVGCTFDITELKLAQEVLHDANRSKNEFLAVLAHELRTPLAAMRNASQVIDHPQTDKASRQRALSVIEQQTRQTVRMVDDLLDLARITNGTIQLRRQNVDLREAMRHALDATAHKREAKRQHLALSQPDTPLMADADPARIQQVFANILSNASRYTPEEGHLSVALGVEPIAGNATGKHAQAVVRIGDDGIGIDRNMLARIFDLFAQATTGRGNGLGVGLNLAKRIVELHGGVIEAVSDGNAQGSEFIVRLPLRTGAPDAKGKDGAAQAPVPPSLRVLVVDDNPDAADMLGSLLALSEHDVRVANEGSSAIAISRGFVPDLVLLDLSMPNMDGWEVARRLRTEPGVEQAFIVAISGFGPDIFAASHREDFDEYITKPLEHDTLMALIRRVRAHRRNRPA